MNEMWTPEETAMSLLAVTLLEQSSEEIEVIEGEVTEVKQPPFYKRPVSQKWAILLCSCLLILSTITATVLLLVYNTTATVTIVRVKRSVSTQTDITLTAAHIFSPISQSATQSAPATGKGHQDATFAQGTITFFNALPAVQTIPSGTLLIAADGTHIITNADATIPAGNLSVNGQITISAHVTTLGSSGNIPAGDFSGACCRDYVFARNNQFSGGQDARDFTIVTQSDSDTLTHSLMSQLDQQQQKAFLGYVPPTETIVPMCSQTMLSTPAVGTAAKTITVSVQRTCSAVSYNNADLTRAIDTQFQQAIHTRLGVSYVPVGLPHLTIGITSLKEHIVKIHALLDGTAVYQFSQQDLQHLKSLVAGKNRNQAVQVLLKWKDIRFAAIQMPDNQNTLPDTVDKIHVNVES